MEGFSVRLIVAVTGASGVEMSIRLLAALREIPDMEVFLIVSRGAATTWKYETDRPLSDLKAMADHVFEENDMAAIIASGSFVTNGMIIMPCSMKTLAGIVSGYADNLIQRAADVCIKEGRKVVLVPREMPLSRIHLRNMSEAADLGCVIVPPMLTFYSGQKTLEDEIDHIAGKILLQFGLKSPFFHAWKEKS